MNRKIPIILAVLLSGFVLPALATDEVFEVRATLRQPIVITEVAFLNFGTIDVPFSPTLFTINPASGAQLNGGNAAEFTIAGENSAAVTVSVTASVTATVGVTTLTFNLTPSPSGGTTLDGAGALTVFVGGDVTVNAGADPGVYTNAVDATLTVIY